jgi:3-mercaptopyruvate sulfurtransferase SseA
MKHHCKYVSKRLALLLMVLFVGTFTLTGCGSGGGSDDYDEPDTGDTAPVEGQEDTNILIDAATLKSIVDSGKVNADSYDRVVIIDTGSYDDGHIPGAQKWTAGSGMVRYEGPVLSGNMVFDGPTMEAALCALGIDANTTVIFAGSGNPGRVYFNFRYWGFGKDRIKVLNGNLDAWTEAGYELTTVVPDVEESDFSLSELEFNPDVRAALSELMIGVREQTVVPLNTYPATSSTEASVGGMFEPGGDYTIFQGLMVGAKAAPFATDFYIDGDSNKGIKSSAEIKQFLADQGIDGSKPIVTYCRAGNLASYGFMPIDIATDYDVMVYDGSWSQWGSLTNDPTVVTDANYLLPNELTEWATDEDLTTAITYNIDNGVALEQPTFRIQEGMLSPYDYAANSIEDEDYEYWLEGEGSSDGASGPVSGGGGGGC